MVALKASYVKEISIYFSNGILNSFLRLAASHSVDKREILHHIENISWNQLFCNFFNKNVVFTKFLYKKIMIVNSRNFHTVSSSPLYSWEGSPWH